MRYQDKLLMIQAIYKRVEVWQYLSRSLGSDHLGKWAVVILVVPSSYSQQCTQVGVFLF